MLEFVKPFAEVCVALIEILGVSVITLIAIHSVLRACFKLLRKEETDVVVQEIRQRLGNGILISLELLIAADIINTVTVKFNLETVSILCIVVLIRTFLSFTLEVELTGKWPWQEKKTQ
ncbi:MAG: DUF1622 domain-containing protein [Erysipelotrichia bacterium]|nr:DUF1622 domain-containing protein [Erysipelotrichia bacterium]